jgi:hypothetical protein
MNMSETDKGGDLNTENDNQTNQGFSNESSVEYSEKTTTELDSGTDVKTSNDGNAVISGWAVNEPAVSESVPVDAEQSEREQSDDSQASNALKKTTTSASEKPYTTFTPWQKRFIILAASTGSFISPLTSNIYFPALNTLASDLHVSISKINLTITTYMVCAPS